MVTAESSLSKRSVVITLQLHFFSLSCFCPIFVVFRHSYLAFFSKVFQKIHKTRTEIGEIQKILLKLLTVDLYLTILPIIRCWRFPQIFIKTQKSEMYLKNDILLADMTAPEIAT